MHDFLSTYRLKQDLSILTILVGLLGCIPCLPKLSLAQFWPSTIPADLHLCFTRPGMLSTPLTWDKLAVLYVRSIVNVVFKGNHSDYLRQGKRCSLADLLWLRSHMFSCLETDLWGETSLIKPCNVWELSFMSGWGTNQAQWGEWTTRAPVITVNRIIPDALQMIVLCIKPSSSKGGQCLERGTEVDCRTYCLWAVGETLHQLGVYTRKRVGVEYHDLVDVLPWHHRTRCDLTIWLPMTQLLCSGTTLDWWYL